MTCLYNIDQINLNNKIISDIDTLENDLNEIINKNDDKIISSLSTLKHLRQLLEDELLKEIDKHNNQNSILYFNNMVLTDCYTVATKIIKDVNISKFILSNSNMKLDDYETLLSTFAFISLYNDSSSPYNISNNNDWQYDRQYSFKYLDIPNYLPFRPQDNSLLPSSDRFAGYSTISFDKSSTDEFKIYETDYSYLYSLNSNINEHNIFTESLAELIQTDLYYDSSKLFITIPTLIQYSPENHNYKILKLCKLSEFPGVKIKYYYPGDGEILSSHIVDPTDPNEIDRSTDLDDNSKLLIPYDPTLNYNDNGSFGANFGLTNPTNLSSDYKSTMTEYEFRMMNIYNETGTLDGGPIFKFKDSDKNKIHFSDDPVEDATLREEFHFNEDGYILKLYKNKTTTDSNDKIFLYRMVIEYPAYLHYYFHDYYDVSTTYGTGRRSNFNSYSFVNPENVIVSYYYDNRDVLCNSNNEEIVNNRIIANKYIGDSTGTTQSTDHNFFINISENENTEYINKNVPIIVNEICYSAVEYQQKNNDTEMVVVPELYSYSNNYKHMGNTYAMINFNSLRRNLVKIIDLKIASQTICVSNNAIDLSKVDSSELDNTRKSLNIPNTISSGIFGEKGLQIYENATNPENTGPKYGFGYKINEYSMIRNKSSERPTTDSRRCFEGVCLKLLLDVYKNSLNKICLIKHKKANSKLRLLIKGNTYIGDNYYNTVYNTPFTNDSEFQINDITDYNEICYGLPYNSQAENILYCYYIDRIYSVDGVDKPKFNKIEYNPSTYEYLSENITSSDYSNVVFKCNRDITNVYIAANINTYDDLMNIKPNEYIIYDFIDCNNIKSIDCSRNINKALIYFKTKDLLKLEERINIYGRVKDKIIDDKYAIDAYIFQYINPITHEVVDGEMIDEKGYKYYRCVVNPDAFDINP